MSRDYPPSANFPQVFLTYNGEVDGIRFCGNGWDIKTLSRRGPSRGQPGSPRPGADAISGPNGWPVLRTWGWPPVNRDHPQLHAIEALAYSGSECHKGDAQEHDTEKNDGDHSLIPLQVRAIRTRGGKCSEPRIFVTP